jgi:hypothetical protein
VVLANFRDLSIAVLAMAFAASPMPAPAQSASSAPLVVPVVIGDGPGMLIPLVLQSAELDEQQNADALQLVEAEGAAIRERLKQIARLDVQLAGLMFAGRRPPTKARISSILQRMAALRQEIVDREVAILLRVRGVLKPEERAAVTAMNADLFEVVSQAGSERSAGDTR